jgi:hypothetical protein
MCGENFVQRTLYTYATIDIIDYENIKYIGSVSINEISMVLHAYEVKSEDKDE